MPITTDQPDENEALLRLREQLQTESNDGLKLSKDVKDNPVCALTIDENVPCATVVWKRHATSTQLRFIHENILHHLTFHQLKGVLGDSTALLTIYAEDQRWIRENWFPRAQAAGLKACASKWPRSYLGKLAVEATQTGAPSGLELRSFEKFEDARDWLRSVLAR